MRTRGVASRAAATIAGSRSSARPPRDRARAARRPVGGDGALHAGVRVARASSACRGSRRSSARSRERPPGVRVALDRRLEAASPRPRDDARAAGQPGDEHRLDLGMGREPREHVALPAPAVRAPRLAQVAQRLLQRAARVRDREARASPSRWATTSSAPRQCPAWLSPTSATTGPAAAPKLHTGGCEPRDRPARAVGQRPRPRRGRPDGALAAPGSRTGVAGRARPRRSTSGPSRPRRRRSRAPAAPRSPPRRTRASIAFVLSTSLRHVTR